MTFHMAGCIMLPMDQLLVFMSYAAEDKHLAGAYKRFLEKFFGFKVFVAHDDNIPSLEWDPEITENIKRCHIFLLLCSESSKRSSFVNQEIGIALCENKRLFPISVDGTKPFGFIAKIQGFPFVDKPDHVVTINSSKLFLILTSRRPEFSVLGDISIHSAALALRSSENFIDTNLTIKILTQAHKQRRFAPRHIKALEQACKSNLEIYGGAFEYPRLKELLEKEYDVKELP
jgi:hypothetical protein